MSEPSGVRLNSLIFRCYAGPDPERRELWIAHCIDLDLFGSGKSFEDAKASLFEAIQGYLETVFDTEDRDSIPELLNRKAPLFYRLRWEVIWKLSKWRHRRDGPGPFQLAPEFRLSQVTA